RPRAAVRRDARERARARRHRGISARPCVCDDERQRQHHRLYGNTIRTHTAHRAGSGRGSRGDGDRRLRGHPETAAVPALLVAADRRRLIHPLHHPVDAERTTIYLRGRGVMIEDVDGHEYIDGLSGLWNVNVGHGRAELADPAAVHMKELAYCSAFVGSSNLPSIELATRVVDLAGGAMDAVFLTSGGAEANESAFKTARFYWKARGLPDKVKIIARDQAYHGLTLQTMSATGMGRGYWKMFEPRVPGFMHVPTCYPYRCENARPGETAGQAAARALEETIVREGQDTVAAFVAEPIHGAGGVFYPTDDYWPLVREICTRHDVLLIADEIVTGFGRTGRWFALSYWNVTP